MTTEEKLKALGFKDSGNFEYYYFKMFHLLETTLKIRFNLETKKGSINNLVSNVYEGIDNFEQLLKWNDFYEKKAKRIARRNEGRNGSETQNQFQQAHQDNYHWRVYKNEEK